MIVLHQFSGVFLNAGKRGGGFFCANKCKFSFVRTVDDINIFNFPVSWNKFRKDDNKDRFYANTENLNCNTWNFYTNKAFSPPDTYRKSRLYGAAFYFRAKIQHKRPESKKC